MAYCEVLYADVVLPLVDTVAVIRAEWMFVAEKLGGVVAQVAEHRQHYHTVEQPLRRLLGVLLEIGELARQCQPQIATDCPKGVACGRCIHCL